MSRSYEETKAAIVASLFSRKDEEGNLEEVLISFLKIQEVEGGHTKSRYLMLAVTKDGKCVIHKCKRNTNGSFSRGKTWQLDDMRVLEEIGPTDFALTMTVRRYHWMTDNAAEQSAFLNSLVQTHKSYKGSLPQLINFHPDGASSAAPSSSSHHQHGTTLASSVPSNGDDLAPPRPKRSDRDGSFSSAGDPRGSSFDSHYRPRLGSTSSRGEHPDVRPGTSASSRGYGESIGIGRPGQRRGSENEARSPSVTGGRLPARRGSDNHVPSAGIEHSRLGQQRRGSDDHGSIASPVIGQRYGSAASNYQPPSASRPMSTATSIPPIVEPEEGEDPYGGLKDEVLASPTVPQNEVPLIPPVNSHPAPPARSPRRGEAAPLTPSPVATQAPPPPEVPAPQSAPAPASNGLTVPSVDDQSRPRDGARPGIGEQQRRVSFHPPPLTTNYSRDVLLTTRTGLLGADGMGSPDDDEAGDAIMANVEEMIEGFDWTASAAAGDKTRSGPDAIESRLLDELAALESANIHAFLESDDRVDQVLSHIDEALKELDDIDIQLSGYRMQLNAVSDDIQYIEGQNRGLQVQTSNQAALLEEIQQLLKITDVSRDDLEKLARTSPSTVRGVRELEHAAASLYKALMATRDTANEVAATTTHVEQYKSSNAAFCARLLDYMGVTFQHQSDITLKEYMRSASRNSHLLSPHAERGEALMQYEGLMLYMKDMDEDAYKKLCLNYITITSKLHQAEMKELLLGAIRPAKAGTTNLANDGSFASAAATIPKSSGLTNLPKPVVRSKTTKRVGDIMRTRDKKTADATRKVSEMYTKSLSEIINQVVTEDSFINSFLHLADTESTFADYMELDTYFRRQAARHASQGMSASMAQIVRQVMELMFGFVDGELKQWVEAAVQGNPASSVGIIATTERLAREAEQEGTSMFLTQLFDKQLGRQRQVFDSFINEQVKTIDAARSTVKKRRGVFYFVQHFPSFVERIECQLDDTSDLEIRKRVNTAYERVVASVLGSLQYSSKLVGAELASNEDKGQLYFHVVMIENLHVFVEEVSQLEVLALAVYVKRAQGLYEENMKAYTRLMLRRGFARLMDFFDGVERQLKTTPAKEVAMHSVHSRSALKKVLKESGAKDMRKAIEAMARRVDKHFSDDDGSGTTTHTHDPATAALIAKVWREVTTALTTEISRATQIISSSYGDTGLSLEYSAKDVESVCARAKRV